MWLHAGSEQASEERKQSNGQAEPSTAETNSKSSLADLPDSPARRCCVHKPACFIKRCARSAMQNAWFVGNAVLYKAVFLPERAVRQ